MKPDHELKCWPESFAAIWRGHKTYDIRRDDRGFKILDLLLLREWGPDSREYTGSELTAEVTHVTRGPEWGIPQGMAVMAIRVLSKAE